MENDRPWICEFQLLVLQRKRSTACDHSILHTHFKVSLGMNHRQFKAFLDEIEREYDLNDKLQGKCQIVSEFHFNSSAFRMKLSSFHLHLLNNNTCDFPNRQKMFHQYHSCQYET
jgi:hypothetical protein